jgi:uncharacterized protein YgiM (DUF1202 family)
MKKHKGLYIFILTIIALAFIVFVAFMQHNFNNPDFSASGTDPVATDTASSKDSGKAESTANEQKENNDEDTVNEEDEQAENEGEEDTDTTTPSIQYVNLDLLTVRSEPDLESKIVGYVTKNQEVEVENINNPDGFVKVTTDEFTGYVKDKFLDPEESE